MRHIKLFLTAILLIGPAIHPATAETSNAPVQGPEAAPTFELDKAGKRARINFNLDPASVSLPGMKLSGFANRKLMIFYFSAVCPHCQHAIPHVQKLADEIAAKGFTTIAIAVKFNSEDDIRGFMKDYKVHLPVFQDTDKTFGENYGTGSIPLLFLVNEKGEYIRYKSFNAEQTPAEIKAEAASIAVAAKGKP
ncbi:MAG TPA: TlpA disulfide reductase family protein [Fibrobacteria bacterium]|nr:TlpA disulfide reductase family protein [Fibrobacteria bacterium]